MIRGDPRAAARIQQHWEIAKTLNPNIFFLALQGSQNYNLQYAESDVDSKAVVIPTLSDIILNKPPVSTTHICDNGEHIDLKDIRLMFQCFWKQNINFLEILFSPFVIVNPLYETEFHQLRANREWIACYNNYAFVNCLYGMAEEKFHALKHPYPTIKWKIDKWGYDGKQAHHIFRLENFFTARLNGEDFENCLTANSVYYNEFLLRVKQNYYSLEEIEPMLLKSREKIKSLKEEYLATHEVEVDHNTRRVVEEILYEVVSKSIKKEIESHE